MADKVLLLIGTGKGVFIAESDGQRDTWSFSGPLCETWPTNHAIGDPATGTIYATGGNRWRGTTVWKSTDLGRSWSRSSEGLAYAAGDEPVVAGWSLASVNGALYAGVQPAGLFRSDDDGETWQHVRGLRDHPTRPDWKPGDAGLILHSIIVDPNDRDRIWVGTSAAGVFHSADGGRTWEQRNTRAPADPAEGDTVPEVGACVHCLAGTPGMGDRLYQQNHSGMFRSEDGGQTWHDIGEGLPTDFGFPATAHPRDPGTLFLFPLDVNTLMPAGGKVAVWRTRDGGASWQEMRTGLPERAYFVVLRQAMATDACQSAGVYFGTSSGALFASTDEGESWTRIAEDLPRILSIETLTMDG